MFSDGDALTMEICRIFQSKDHVKISDQWTEMGQMK